MKKAATLSMTILIPFSSAASMHLAIQIFVFGGSAQSDPWGLAVWWICLAITAPVLHEVLKRPRKQQTVLVICMAALTFQTIFIFLSPASYGKVTSWIFVFALWALSYLVCGRISLICPKPETLMYLFEITLGVSALACVMFSAGVLPLLSWISSCAGMLAALFALAEYREISGRSLKGTILRIAIAGAAGVISALTVTLTSGISGAFFGHIVMWGKKFFLSIAGAINYFMVWFASLFPEESLDIEVDQYAETTGSIDTDTTIISHDAKNILLIVMICLVIAAVIAVIAIWIKVKGRRITVSSGKPGAKISRKKDRTFPPRLRRLFWYLKNRNTPEGFLIWLDKTMKHKGRGRNSGESSRAFLKRISEEISAAFPGHDKEQELLQSKNLGELALWLDRCYFAPECPAPFSEKIPEMRAFVRKYR